MATLLAVPCLASITRDTFNKYKNYRELIIQIGKPVFDAEMNELQQNKDYRDRQLVNSMGDIFLGNGFKVAESSINSVNNFSITAGEGFIGGVFAGLQSSLEYSAQVALASHLKQFYWNSIVTVPTLTMPTTGNRNDLVVLNFALREITASDDSNLLDPTYLAEGARRWKVETGISVLEAFPTLATLCMNSFTYYNDDGCWRAPIAWLSRVANISAITTGMIQDLRKRHNLPVTGVDGTVLLADSTMASGLKFGTIPEPSAIADGWVSSGETWTPVVAGNSITTLKEFSVMIPGDKTLKYSKDMKVRLQQIQNLTSVWTMDNTLADIVGINTLYTIGTPTYSTGKFGGANGCAVLDGTSKAFMMTSAPNLCPTGDFTFGAWISISTMATEQTIFQSMSKNLNWKGVQVSVATNSVVVVYVGNSTGTLATLGYSAVWGKTGVTLNTWVNVVVTGKNNLAQIYVNGELDSMGYIPTPVYNTIATQNFVRIGCAASTMGTMNFGWLKGSIDDVYLIADQALDGQTIKDLYLAQTAIGSSPRTLTKYFSITSVNCIATQTLVTLFGGADYSLASSTINSPFYALVDTPYRYDENANKWGRQTYPYYTFLIAGSFSPPSWCKKIQYVLFGAGNSGGAGAGGDVTGGGGAGGAGGGAAFGILDIAAFKGNYGITYGTAGGNTYFNALPNIAGGGELGASGGAGSVWNGSNGGNGNNAGALFGAGGGGGASSTNGAGIGGSSASLTGGAGAGLNQSSPAQMLPGTGGGGGNYSAGAGGAGGYGSGGGGGAAGVGGGGAGGAGGQGFAIIWFLKGDEI